MTFSPSHRVDLKRMASKASLKQKFLKKWMEGLRTYGSSNPFTTVSERKRIIKLSADIAMASIQEGATKWSRALIENASQGMDTFKKSAMSDDRGARLPSAASVAKKIASKKISKSRRRRTRICEPPRPKRLQARSIAKRLVKKRTQVLKNLVPGGESMDDASLIKETLDYIMSLQVQVDVMRSLACMSEHLHRK
ncbi:hypothetical protein SAY87_007113 [Trapa incisa]|uniref:IBH1-like N-terminal domain-containing protein n=1 Tax=Trapa incisa TaxID=236973 RepID=A0AAN7JZR0_9MYRT|nr:hypothetical protein SAY87_007113 [Trapa incisa]